jgi:two-component system response regulator AtoC
VQLLIQTGAGTGGPAGLNFRGFTGTSAAVRAALQQAAGLAQSSAPVLIRGERGTGRKTLARAMHESGPHRTRRFVVFECAGTDDELLALLLFGAAGRPGRLDQDDIGTVFLEDIGCMSPVLQARLLDWLKTVAGPDKAGVVAACSRDLAGLVSRGEFRTELDDLLRKQELVMPPLRERREDIPGLIAFLVGQSDREFNRGVTGVSKDATERLMAGKWPGNIAELQRVIERAVLLADGPLVESDDLPAAVVVPQAAGLGS